MKPDMTNRPLLPMFMCLAALAGMPATPAAALPAVDRETAAPEQPVHLASGECYAIGQQIAAERGGQLANARVENRGGQQVCVVIVLIPAQDGQRPRRSEIVVPL